MTDECRVYWGSHGCKFKRGHEGPHECDCCTCEDHATKHKFVNFEDGECVEWSCVAKQPYYGPRTRFYGEDAPDPTPPKAGD